MDFFLFRDSIGRMDSFSCTIFPKCPGCSFQKRVTSPPVFGELKMFFGEALDSNLVCSSLTSWRSKVKLAIRGEIENPQIGLFARGSHDVVDMEECPLHHPSINKALISIRKGIKACGAAPYCEKTGRGRLRYVQMHAQKKTGLVQICFMLNGEEVLSEERAFFAALSEESFCHSVWVNFVPGATNTILGERFECLFGPEEFVQEIKEIPFYFHPSSFAQANLDVFSLMLDEINNLVMPGQKVWELYAGVGCIGVFLAQKSTKVTLVESSPLSKEMHEKTAAKASLENCHFYQKRVEGVSFFDEANVLIVDPPRKGLSASCREKINESSAFQLIYVSCGPDSLMRDTKELEKNGWKAKSAKGFLLFPGSNHVEMVVSFERK